MDKSYIVIVTYNGMKWLEKCLESTANFPVVVIDNNSEDGTIQFIEEKFPEIVCFPQNKNLGFGPANNIGISYALKKGAEHVFLLNQDAYLKDNSLEKLIQTQKENTEYGVVSPIHLNGEGNRLDQYFSNYLNYKANANFYSDFVLDKKKSDIYEVPFVNAAGWLISRNCLEKVGGFDPLFFQYGEDDNYCQRLKYHNFKIGVVLDTFILHDREDRDVIKYLSKKENHLKHLERNIKLNFANINLADISGLDELIKSKQKQARKNLIKLNFQNFAFTNKEIEMLKRLKIDINKSRQTNKEPDRNHLDF
jgi:GT2 family glycosyltransferase